MDPHAVGRAFEIRRWLLPVHSDRWIHMLLGCLFENHGLLLLVHSGRWIHMLFGGKEPPAKEQLDAQRLQRAFAPRLRVSLSKNTGASPHASVARNTPEMAPFT